MALIIFHLQDAAGKPLGGVVAKSVGGPGPWESVTNACGDVVDPVTGAAGVTLDAGHYEVTFTKAGYQTLTLPADLAECGIITQALQKGSTTPTPIPPEGGSGVLPAVPTRAQVASVQHALAGLTYHTTEFGDVPAWFYGRLNAEDRAEARACHRAAGCTHIPFPLTEAYREGGTLWPAELADGYDYTSDEGLETWRAIAQEAICDGFLIDCAMGGDGLGVGPNYNDPVGRTYGYGWLMANMERMLLSIKGDGSKERPDLTKYTAWRPGWDACFYGWGGVEPGPNAATPMAVQPTLRWWWKTNPTRFPQPTLHNTGTLDDQQQRVKDFGEKFRSILPAGVLTMEHTPGNIPIGLGPADWAPGGVMQTYDALLSEYATVHEDSYWQVVGRCIEPYYRPSDQPSGDDPHPPKYLPGQLTPRGPFYYVAFEPTTAGVYEWCRGRCSREAMQQQDAYMRATGVTLTGYPVHW